MTTLGKPAVMWAVLLASAGALAFARDPAVAAQYATPVPTVLTSTPAPAATSAGRLSQIRRLATEFSATVIDTRNVDTPVPRILRLMPQPLFRYPAPVDGADYMDGALFTFVEGTDPEVMLLIEATHSDGVPSWRFGVARMNGDELRVSHRDQPVWQVPRVSWQEMRQHPHQPYYLFILDAESGRVKP